MHGIPSVETHVALSEIRGQLHELTRRYILSFSCAATLKHGEGKVTKLLWFPSFINTFSLGTVINSWLAGLNLLIIILS